MAAKKFISYGICQLCKAKLPKSNVTRHFGRCLPDYPEGNHQGTFYQLRIEARYDTNYWLQVEMAGDGELLDLDKFLRAIWLECCGHMSGFFVPQNKPNPWVAAQVVKKAKTGWGPDEIYSILSELDYELAPGEIPKTTNIGEVFSELNTLRYDYDFGDTTELALKIVGSRTGSGPLLRLLARNEAPTFRCEKCPQPAQWICPCCFEDPFYCHEHAEEHDCGDAEMMLPVVNSPRMGICGYSGPQ